MEPTQGANIQILGFYIKDTRQTPNIAICKNCTFPLVPDPTTEEGFKKREKEKDILREPPEFFQYAGEAYSHIKKMGLSEEQEAQMKLVALTPMPDSLCDSHPTHIFMDKDELKER